MRIIIVGSGRSCELLVRQMEKSEHDIIVVDKNREVVDAITDKYSVNGVCGSGASREVLLAAGADSADILISLTPVDEINLLACSMAKYLGTGYAAARITGEDLLKDVPYLLEKFSVDYILNPKQIFAEALAEQVFFNAVNRVPCAAGGDCCGAGQHLKSCDASGYQARVEHRFSCLRRLAEGQYPDPAGQFCPAGGGYCGDHCGTA